MARVVITAMLGLFIVFPVGCNEAESGASWDDVKIGNLDTVQSGKARLGQSLRTANFDVYVYEVPAANVGKLDDVWESLFVRPVRFYNYRAFTGNLFRVGMGKRFRWSGVEDMLRAAGGKRMVKVTALLPDGQPDNLPVTAVDRPQEVSYIGLDLSREKLIVGPGIVTLRVTAEDVGGARGVCQVVAYPAFTVPMASAEGPIGDHAKRQEVEFKAAGFGLKMSPDDFVVLGPRKYLSERATLSGLFFSNLEGTMFLERGKRPKRKISVRVFVVVCTGIGY